ncbi:MAG TPA: hypothetical protein VGK59_07665 [Ohtaekwangia sp.]
MTPPARASRQSVPSLLTQNLGNGLTALNYEAAITDLRTKLNEYNTALSQVDALHNAMKESEKSLSELSERMLIGVAAKYGKNSSEYEKAGGVRKSERRKPVKKKAVTA